MGFSEALSRGGKATQPGMAWVDSQAPSSHGCLGWWLKRLVLSQGSWEPWMVSEGGHSTVL